MESDLGLGKCRVVVCRYFYLDTAEMIGLCLVLCRLLGTLRWRPPLGPASPSSLLSWSEYLTGTGILTATTCCCRPEVLLFVFHVSAEFDEYLTTTDILQPGPGTCAGLCWRAVIRADTASTLPVFTLTEEGGQRAHYFIQN